MESVHSKTTGTMHVYAIHVFCGLYFTGLVKLTITHLSINLIYKVPFQMLAFISKALYKHSLKQKITER